MLSTAEQHLVRCHVAALADLPLPAGVPCHLDYQPHNWLIDHTGVLRIVDFEHARVDTAARDLVRLAFRHWPGQPDRRAAFLDGYGRDLTQSERRLLTHCAALDAVTSLARAHETKNPTLAEHGRATLYQLPPLP
jgi:thiamine kinase-like enzyme